MSEKSVLLLALAAALGTVASVVPAVAWAQTDHSQHGAAQPAAKTAAKAPADTALAEGEIRRVDRGARKLTIRHGEIRNLDMPPMTMVFGVKDPALLDAVKAGDKVRFRAEKAGEDLVVTAIEPARK